MDSNKPMELIQDWQEWYEKNNSVFDGEAAKPLQQKATDYFADTISEFNNEMTAEELYDCLKKAAEENYLYAKKQYEFAKTFWEMVRGYL
jgi:hypothetical protein